MQEPLPATAPLTATPTKRDAVQRPSDPRLRPERAILAPGWWAMQVLILPLLPCESKDQPWKRVIDRAIDDRQPLVWAGHRLVGHVRRGPYRPPAAGGFAPFPRHDPRQ